MQLSFVSAMSDIDHGFEIASPLLSSIGIAITSKGVDTSKMKNKAHRGLPLAIWLNCGLTSANQQWAGAQALGDGSLAFGWGKLVKPRGQNELEWYMRLNFEALVNTDDRLKTLLGAIANGLVFLTENHGIIFNGLKGQQLCEAIQHDIHQAAKLSEPPLSNRGTIKAPIVIPT